MRKRKLDDIYLEIAKHSKNPKFKYVLTSKGFFGSSCENSVIEYNKSTDKDILLTEDWPVNLIVIYPAKKEQSKCSMIKLNNLFYDYWQNEIKRVVENIENTKRSLKIYKECRPVYSNLISNLIMYYPDQIEYKSLTDKEDYYSASIEFKKGFFIDNISGYIGKCQSTFNAYLPEEKYELSAQSLSGQDVISMINAFKKLAFR